jgi:hypothetical protein
MTHFAALDDSLVYQNGIYVYSHALTVFDQEPDVIYFVGDKRDIYTHESELGVFVTGILPEECSLFACMHYFQYSDFWDQLVCQGVDKQHPVPKNVHRLFIQSHHAAKNTAKRVLEEILRGV